MSMRVKVAEAPERRACCAGLEASPVDPARTADLAGALKALADPHRLTVLEILAAAGGPVCVCDLEEHLPLGQPTVSHHLRVLTEAGFLEREQVGRWAYYRPRPGRLAEVAAALGDLGGR